MSKRLKKLLVRVAGIAVLVPLLHIGTACTQESDSSNPETQVLLQLKQQTVTVADFVKHFNTPHRTSQRVNAEEVQNSLDNLIHEIVMNDIAEANGLKQRDDYIVEAQKIERRARRELFELTRTRLLDYLGDDVTIDEAALALFYDQNKQKYVGRQVAVHKYRFTHVEDARDWHGTFSSAEPDAKITLEKQLAPSRFTHTDEGWLSRTSAEADMRHILMRLNRINPVSKLITSDQGAYFYVFAGERSNVPREFADTRPQLRAQLEKKLAEQALEKLIRAQVDEVEINSAALDSIVFKLVDMSSPTKLRVRVPKRKDEVEESSAH